MLRKILTYALGCGLLWSCNDGVRQTDKSEMADTTEEYVPIDATSDTADMHNAQNSLDIAGIYTGVLPCADCEGIRTEITLKDDSTYVRKSTYLGKGDGTPQEEEGKYSWLDGSTIELRGIKDGPRNYFVGENTLTQLDMSGNKITGELAEKYMLQK
ncbi:copper resistance protein NlpE [Olivibacter sp. XZL3]|uniref:copper resistance protein NlpE n=1 Tax=Olivibacter sp. XZL3 TaxID=1735116 RepID=UPI00197EF7AF|nr:copper resistance protein NlpE [Olivibacter sp. XZL3]